MKVTVTKIWVTAALLALIGIAQAQNEDGVMPIVEVGVLDAKADFNVKQ